MTHPLDTYDDYEGVLATRTDVLTRLIDTTTRIAADHYHGGDHHQAALAYRAALTFAWTLIQDTHPHLPNLPQ